MVMTEVRDRSGKVNRMMSCSAITAEDIADDIYNAVLNNELWVVPHKLERHLWILKRWLPNYYHKQFSKKAKALVAGFRDGTNQLPSLPPC